MLQPIIFFDSGIGGLSILKAWLNHFSYPSILYVADQAFFPYGNKSASELRQRLLQLFNWFALQHPLAVVVACNTATSLSLTELRQLYSFPLIGVEPVIKPLAQYSPSLLLATPLTVASRRTQRLIHRYQPKDLQLYPSKNLAFYIETMNQVKIDQELQSIKSKYTSFNFQAIGLSCTHYPLIQDQIRQFFPQAKIIDPSLAVAKQISKTIPQPSTINHPSTIRWFTTASPTNLARQISHYLHLQAQPLSLQL